MIKFIHTADIHFGVENYGRIDPATGIHTRLLDFYGALQRCIDRAIEEEVDLFLFSGDAYKTAYPTPTQQRLLLESFLRLFRAQIPIIMVIGNHDNALSFGKAHALEVFGQIPISGFHVIAKPSTVTVQTKQGPLNIVGIPWPSRTSIALHADHTQQSQLHLSERISDAVVAIIQELAEGLDPAIPAILAGHLTVSTGIFSGSEKRAIYGSDPIILPSQLAIKPFDYVALGHLHRYQNLNEAGYPAVVYSGSLERIDFGERKESKGFCLVRIPEKGKAEHEFIPLTTRPFIQIELRITEADQTKQILEKIAQCALSDAVVKIIYHLPAGVRDTVDITQIQRACVAAHYLVGIIPIRQIAPATQRSRLLPAAAHTINSLLEHYIAAKPELLPHKERLLSKIAAMVSAESLKDDRLL